MNNQIWQVQQGAVDNTQATAGAANTIVFGPATTGVGNDLFASNITLRNSTPENTSIEGDSNDIEDMGLDGLDFKLTGHFADNQTDITKLVKWWQEDKFTDVAPEGRFGLELNYPTDFNVVPTATYGYQIVNPTMEILYEQPKIVNFTMTLRLGGDVASAI